MAIHPTAQVDGSAQLAEGVEVGAWSIVGPGVTLAEGVRVASHVVIQQDTTVGAGTTIHPFCVMGGDPQHGGYKGEPVALEIGANCTVREHSTFNRGTPGDRKLTTIGDGCLFMTGAHVGHDAVVGNHVTFANNATLGGHTRVGDRVFLGGLCAVHQFGRVGQGAIVGGLSAVTRDVIPYGSAWGNHVRLHGLNLIGLKRKGYGKVEVRRLLAAYRDIFEAPGLFSERLDAAQAAYADLPEIQEIIAFIREDTRRPVALPGE